MMLHNCEGITKKDFIAIDDFNSASSKPSYHSFLAPNIGTFPNKKLIIVFTDHPAAAAASQRPKEYNECGTTGGTEKHVARTRKLKLAVWLVMLAGVVWVDVLFTWPFAVLTGFWLIYEFTGVWRCIIIIIIY